MYSESHCHLRGVSPEVMEKAKRDGFTLLLTSGIDLASSEEALETASRYDIVRACVGVHPWYADEYDKGVEARFREMATDEQVVAISEIGLDYVGRMTKERVREDKYIDKEIQRKAFRDQLSLARELGLPALVHDRTPNTELLDILDEMGSAGTGVAIHGFSKGLDYAARCVERGVYLSVGLRTIQAKDPDFLKAIEETPMEWLLTETDSSNPEGVLQVCDEIAELKRLTREEVGRVATENLMRLTGL